MFDNNSKNRFENSDYKVKVFSSGLDLDTMSSLKVYKLKNF